MVNPRKKPKFEKWMSQTYKRVKKSWRRARGIHSKVRVKEKSKIRMPAIGWGAPKNLRNMHPSGFKEVLIYNLNELEKVDAKKEAVKIFHAIGKKKRKEILEKAEKLKIKVLNP
jgi:large subunit ribosomal protein L32e